MELWRDASTAKSLQSTLLLQNNVQHSSHSVVDKWYCPKLNDSGEQSIVLLTGYLCMVAKQEVKRYASDSDEWNTKRYKHNHMLIVVEMNSVISISGVVSQRENKKGNCYVSIYFHSYCMTESHSAASAICRWVSQQNIPKAQEKGLCVAFSTHSNSPTGRVPHPVKERV